MKEPFFKLEDFELGQRLGGGRYGQVFVALYRPEQFVCALKIISKSELVRLNAVLLLKREVEIQSRLRHENILRLYGHFFDERHAYLILEFAQQGNLYRALKRILVFPEQKVAKIIAALTKALAYLKSKNIIHRDVKPENILLNHHGVPKLSDFGWAVHTINERKSICGTLDYLAPEMVCQKPYSGEIDVWAVGVLTFELLTGKPPFECEKTDEQYSKIRNGAYSWPEKIKVSDEAKFFVNLCLQIDPEKRIKIEDVLKSPWFIKNKIS